jgi:hypothetical protein
MEEGFDKKKALALVRVNCCSARESARISKNKAAGEVK